VARYNLLFVTNVDIVELVISLSLPGQRARKEIFDEVNKLVEKYGDKLKPDDILTRIGVEIGLTPTKSREYYRDVTNYKRIVAEEGKTKEEIAEDREIALIDEQLKKDKVRCGIGKRLV
jgi:hypothetical protein